MQLKNEQTNLVETSFPEHWTTMRLDQAYSFTKKPRDLDIQSYEAVPFVPMDLIPIGAEFFDQYELRPGHTISSGTYFEPGDILLSKITPSFENGKQGIIEQLPTSFGYATTEVIPIKPIPGRSDALFLFYYLLRHSIRDGLAEKMEGSTGRQRLNKSTLEELEIALPPLPEQHAIAQALRAVQSARQAREREAALERERKAALMQRLFTRGTRGEPTKTTEIGEMPESWRVVPLEKIVQRKQYGLSLAGKAEGSVPILRMNSLSDGGIAVDDLQYVDLDQATLEQFRLNKGDLLFNRTNSYELVGKTGLFELDRTFVFASYLVRVTLVAGEAEPAFFNAYLNWAPTQMRLKAMASRGVSQSNINATKLVSLLVPQPSPDEQRAIAGALRACDEAIAAREREAAAHGELFRALLEELMTGRRRVGDTSL